MATLTYDYGGQIAVLGPLALHAEPHAYDLCEQHSQRLSAPRGWEVLRLANDSSEREPSHDDLVALANAVREAAKPPAMTKPVVVADESGSREGTRRGHLRVLTPADD